MEVEPPARFFAKAFEDYPEPPVWVGELYLETHRGTYTSQAGNKQGNRRSEHLLYEAELWAPRPPCAPATPTRTRTWTASGRTSCCTSSTTSCPASSIAWVHRESRETYERLAGELEAIIAGAQRALAGDAGPGGELVFNAAPHARGGVPAGGATLADAPPEAATRTELDGNHLLDNGLVRATVDARGLLVSVVDLASGREVVAPGTPANLLQLHPDLPAKYDAWDVDHAYRRTVTDLTDVETLEPVPGEAAVRVVRRFGASRVTQVISLAPGSGRVDIDTEVDWHEAETLLKAAFPLDVRAERSAAETQFGYVHRATDTNTSWEAAKYEICAHRYLHVAEPGFGVALVNDSTYGHDVTRTVRPATNGTAGGTTTTVRLSLLRAPRFPDPETDQGVHRMRFALVPGADLVDATREGYRLNLPERRVPGGTEVEPLARTDHEGVVISAVKLADDGSGDVVVRLYEALGARASARLELGFAATAGVETDLLERPFDGGLTSDGTTVELVLRPFQVVTMRFSYPGGDRQ